ncbi:MAG: thioredoxin domain-containing protein [Nocardioidaceae bacterium]|nr:MAG: thioredoxin domain-containing protein [Nocardioidaceae bacterium]
MKLQTKVSLLIAGIFAVVLGWLLAAAGRDDEPDAPPGSSAANERIVREDSHVLGEEGSSEVVLVEFLDFECEGCRAAYPIVEGLREEYAGQVTFVARYFPLPGHFNAERAARAVESAARQGEFEAMYQRMFETQAQWGEQQTPADDLFRQYAVDLGLDMEQYDSDYASKEVADRVQRDVDDGLALGVQGTPTFFLNGERFEPSSVQDFNTAIDAALAE